MRRSALSCAPPSHVLLRPRSDNWQQVDPAWLTNWISTHAADAKKVLKKPLVLEEHGKVGEGVLAAGLATKGCAGGMPLQLAAGRARSDPHYCRPRPLRSG